MKLSKEAEMLGSKPLFETEQRYGITYRQWLVGMVLSRAGDFGADTLAWDAIEQADAVLEALVKDEESKKEAPCPT